MHNSLKKRLFAHLYSILVISCTFGLVQKKKKLLTVLVWFCVNFARKVSLEIFDLNRLIRLCGCTCVRFIFWPRIFLLWHREKWYFSVDFFQILPFWEAFCCHSTVFVIIETRVWTTPRVSDDYTGYTNVLKIDLKCPEKYIKAYIFVIIQWIEIKFENVKYISIYLTNI
jgi:hypothetical protein